MGVVRSANYANLLDARDKKQAPHLTPHHRDIKFQHTYDRDSSSQLQLTLEGNSFPFQVFPNYEYEIPVCRKRID